jgi:DNA-binding ferritin-like protein
MDKITLSNIIEDYHTLGRRLQKYIDQLSTDDESTIETLEDALTEIDSAVDDMEGVNE